MRRSADSCRLGSGASVMLAGPHRFRVALWSRQRARGWAQTWSACRSTLPRATPWRLARVPFPPTWRSFTTRSTCCLATSRESSSSTASTCTTPSAMCTIWSRLLKSYWTSRASVSFCPCCGWSSRARTSFCSISTHQKGSIWNPTFLRAMVTQTVLTRLLIRVQHTGITSRLLPRLKPLCADLLTLSAPAAMGQRLLFLYWEEISYRSRLERSDRWPSSVTRATRVWDLASAEDPSMELGSMCHW